MKESNIITVIYKKPKKYYFVIELGDSQIDFLCQKVCDTYDEAVKLAHDLNQGNSDEYFYIVAESKYYTGTKNTKFYGMEFEEIKDSGDME